METIKCNKKKTKKNDHIKLEKKIIISSQKI